MKKLKKDVTIKDIARIAGVSVATISRAINNRKGVRPETKEKVLKVVQRYNYFPNIYAQVLVKQKVKNIGLIFPYNLDMLMDMYLTELTSHIEDETLKYGYDFTLYFPHSTLPSEIENQYLELFRSKKVGGLLIGGVQVDDKTVRLLINEGYPFFIIGSHLNYLNYNFVDVDHKSAVEEAVSYLAEKGLKKIAYIGTPLSFSTPIEKFLGYKSALAKYNIELDTKIIFHNINSYIEAFNLCWRMITEKNVPQAFFCENDMLAWGIINSLLKAKIRIPEDVSIIGYNDTEFSNKIYPALTTIHLPIEQIAFEAVKSIIFLIEKKVNTVEPKILKASLVLRETTIK